MYLVHGIVPSDEIIISLVASIAKMVYIHFVQVHIYINSAAVSEFFP